MGKSGKKLHYEGSSFHRVSLNAAPNNLALPVHTAVGSLVNRTPGLVSAHSNPVCLELLSGGDCSWCHFVLNLCLLALQVIPNFMLQVSGWPLICPDRALHPDALWLDLAHSQVASSPATLS